jgi:predicted GIY-YIG superfamily endonuclease
VIDDIEKVDWEEVERMSAMFGCPPSYKVYVIECTAKTGRVTVHVGIAQFVDRRIENHRSGMVKATRGREIVLLGNSERMTKEDALRLEMKLKALRPAEKRGWASEQGESNDDPGE